MNHHLNSIKNGSHSRSKAQDMALAMDVYGNMTPVRKEPKRHWAAPVVTFDNGMTANGHNDSDRLWFANIDKYNEVSRRLFGSESHWWDGRTPTQVELFLREFFDNPKLILVQIQKMYNVSSGFPIWGFSYHL